MKFSRQNACREVTQESLQEASDSMWIPELVRLEEVDIALCRSSYQLTAHKEPVGNTNRC